eukprot:5433432-Amphidinium_carterae.1
MQFKQQLWKIGVKAEFSRIGLWASWLVSCRTPLSLQNPNSWSCQKWAKKIVSTIVEGKNLEALKGSFFETGLLTQNEFVTARSLVFDWDDGCDQKMLVGLPLMPSAPKL